MGGETKNKAKDQKEKDALLITDAVARIAITSNAPVANTNDSGDGGNLFGQLKIMVTFFQILSSFPTVFSSIPWPLELIQISIPMNWFNLEMFSMLEAPATCSLMVPFLEQFIVHMAYPVMLLLTVLGASTASNICGKKTTSAKSQRTAELYKVLIVVVLLMYPGLATRIFGVFRCQQIDGVLHPVLSADVSQSCYLGKHYYYSIVAFVFMGLYIVGIPLYIVILLLRNRKALHDKSHPNHDAVKYELDGLYIQYEPKYYWFELVIVIHKMIMTGAISIVANGTPLQPLVGCLFQLLILMVTLKLAPYADVYDDWGSFNSLLAIMLTMMLGFALISDDRDNPTFPPNIVTLILIIINGTVVVVNVGIMMLVCIGVKARKRCYRCVTCNNCLIKRLRKRRTKKRMKKLKTKVAPLFGKTSLTIKRMAEKEEEELSPFTKEERARWIFHQTFYCPITHAVMHDPVVDINGDTYERTAIEEWISRNKSSPITREAMERTDLRPNRTLRETIELEIAKLRRIEEEKRMKQLKKQSLQKASIMSLISTIIPPCDKLKNAMLANPKDWNKVNDILQQHPEVAQELIPIVNDEGPI